MSNGETINSIKRILTGDQEIPEKVSNELLLAAITDNYQNISCFQDELHDIKDKQNRRDIEIGGRYRLADGTLEKFVITTKVGVRKTFKNIPHDMRDKLIALKEENVYEPICLYPDAERWKDDIWEGDWLNTYNESYDYKTTYYSITIEFEEK